MTELFRLLGTVAVETGDAKKALNDVSQEGQKTESKLSNTFSKIGKGAAVMGKAIATGMAAGATAVAGLVTAAVSAYADYEQLVGGVDTLFKESSAKVQEYAKNAYKTAGMSANEYMETVTSFSASLLQSLDGDTAKAAEKADQAITDMSDNANKMGSDIAMIQNAYNGFAKQNYTMLDNLKLGYGGTKEEMQRLLDDAQKLSGVKYDISSYADIVDAIHVVQTEMGITGTTAKEAASTISGSLSSMKGAWQNVLTAVASDDLPFDDYVTAFVDSVSNVASNLMPRIQTALNGVVQLIEQLAPVIVNKFPELINSLLPSIITAAQGIVSAIISALPGILQAILSAAPQLIEGFVSVVNSLIEALPSMVQAICDALPTLIPALINGIVSMIVTLCENFSAIIQPLIDALPGIIISLVEAIVQNLPVLIQGIITLIMGIVEAIPQIIQALVDALPTVCSMLTQSLLENLPLIIMGLIQVVLGIVKALPQILGSLIQSVPAALSGIWDGIGKVFSKLGSKIGTWLKEAINNIKEWASNIGTKAKEAGSNFLNNVVNTIKELPGKVWNWLKNVINKIKDWASDMVKKGKEAAQKLLKTVVDKIKEIPTKIVNVGKDLVSGIWNGISNGLTWIKNKIKGWVGNVTKFIKNLFGIKSPSTVMRDEVGRYIAQGVAVGIEENISEVEKATEELNQKVLDAAQKRLDDYKTYNDMTLAEEVGFWDEVRVQLKEGTDARIEADKKYLDAKKDLNEQIATAEEKLQKELEAIYQTTENRKKELLGSVDIFANFDPESSSFNFSDELLLDAAAQIDSLERYESVMASLEQKLSGTALWEELKTQGIDKLNELYHVNQMAEEDLMQYAQLWDERLEVAQRIAEKETAEDKETAIEKAMKAFEETLGALGVEISDNTTATGNNTLATLSQDGATGINTGAINAASETIANAAETVSGEAVARYNPKDSHDAYEFLTGKTDITRYPTGYAYKKPEGISDKEWTAYQYWGLKGSHIENLGYTMHPFKGYASAVRNPVVMKKPTIFGYSAADSKFLLGGEAGEEVVSGTTTLMGMIQSAVATQNEAMTYQLKKIIEMLAAFFPQLLEAFNIDLFIDGRRLATELAPDMDDALGIISSRKERGR